MSKSKGNGVDPVDIIEKFGADALRFGLAYLTTETQDVRMPVEFECPHCGALIEQTKKNRVLPRVDVQEVRPGVFDAMGRRRRPTWPCRAAAVVSERFELARNFCNKLWNAVAVRADEPGGVRAGAGGRRRAGRSKTAGSSAGWPR